ncbi:hypothetical protein [Raoultella planticola]|uniref:hypothetical protein n=1 Tax=Raoultella planticola TaxID=575 RepID=UPI002073323B|nr:hypothetical protein [Raoultella planticola]
MDVKGMRLSACPVTDRRRTRSRRPGQRRREAVGFPDTAPDTLVRPPTASVRVPVAPVSAAPSGDRGIPGHGA